MRTKSLKAVTILMLLTFLLGNVAAVLAAPSYLGEGQPSPVFSSAVSLRSSLVVTDTKAMTATETMTKTEAMTATETMTKTEVMTATEAMTATEVMTATEAMTATETMTKTEVMTATETMTATEAMTTTEAVTTTAATTETVAATAAGCASDHVVVAGDTLGTVAAQYPGVGYQAIFEATNAAAAKGGAYTTIADINIINVGQTLCIPAAGTVATGATTTTSTKTVTETKTVEIMMKDGKLMMADGTAVDGKLVTKYDGKVVDVWMSNGTMMMTGTMMMSDTTGMTGTGMMTESMTAMTVTTPIMVWMADGTSYDVNMVDGKMMMSMPVVMTVTETGKTETKAMGMDIPAGKAAVSFENLSPVDTIVDVVSDPPIDAQLIIPTTKRSFLLEPGSYKFNAGSPGGTYGTSGEFVVGPNQWAEVIIFGDSNNVFIRGNAMNAAPTTTATTTATAAATTATTATATTTTTATTATTTTATTDTSTFAVLAVPGKARVFLYNDYSDTYQVDFGDGAGLLKVPVGELKFYHDLNPGTYRPGFSLEGGPGVNFDITVGAGEVWGITVTAGGIPVGLRLYPEVK